MSSDTSLRVTFVLPYAGLAGGVRVVALYADRLKQRGHRVFVVSTPRPTQPLRRRIKAAVLRKGPTAPPPADHSYFDNLDVEHVTLESHRPVRAVDVPDADVIVATWWETAEWVHALPMSKGAKAYFVQHYEAHPGQSVNRVDATWRLPLHKIAVAQWLRQLALDRFDDADVSLAPNAVDLVQFSAPPRSKQSQPTVGMMYSRAKFKGCDLSIKAYEIAKRRLPQLQFTAFGACEPAPELPLPPSAHYRQQPPQSELRDIYASCDAWLFGSRSEGFGLPILEAMACRTPVIAMPTGAAPELVEQGGGLLIRPEDPEAMATAIGRIAALSDQSWRTMSDKAHATASGFTWDDATDLFEKGLRQAISRSALAQTAV